VWIALLTALIAVGYAYHRSHRATGGFEINHVTTFTLGFLFYWFLPTLLVTGLAGLSPESVDSVSNYFGDIPSHRLTGYELSLLVLYCSFSLGDFLGAFPIIKARSQPRNGSFQPKLWYVAAAVVFLVFLAVLFEVRGQIFASYESADFIARGTLVAVTIVMFSISLRMALERRWGLMKFYFLLSISLLAMGGRLYFASSVISVLSFLSHRKPIRARLLIIGGCASILAMGVIGVLRVHSQASVMVLALNVATESLFTSFSLFSYLSGNQIAWAHLPTYLLGDISNLIPSFFIDKHHIVSLTDSSYGIESPLGALNSWVSFNVNFGLIGTMFALFLFGYLMRRFERMTVSYLMLTGFTAFTFFRDPFSISIVKNMFEFSVLIPFLIEKVNQLVAYSVAAGIQAENSGNASEGIAT
jgi:hypothetical protein